MKPVKNIGINGKPTPRKSGFDLWMETHQVTCRNRPMAQVCREHGWQNEVQYPWILPGKEREQSLWSGIHNNE
jgi:hypothetical protein